MKASILLSLLAVGMATAFVPAGPLSNFASLPFNMYNTLLAPFRQMVHAPPVATPTKPITAEPIKEVKNDIAEDEEEHVHQEEEDHKDEGGHSHFGYEDPNSWARYFPDCGGKMQSPIDLDEKYFTPKAFGPLEASGYMETPITMTLSNNGHAIEVAGTWAEDKRPTLTGGPLGSDEYVFEQMHVHWGRDDNSGSEHLINGRQLAMELHVVHWNKKYGSFKTAASSPNGLAVFGFFFQAAPFENPMLQRWIEPMSKVAGNKPIKIEIDPMPIDALNLARPGTPYATYLGSLTTPPCTEGVRFIMSMKPLYCSSKQLEAIRTVVKDEDHDFIHNFRPVQPLNDRQINFSFQ